MNYYCPSSVDAVREGIQRSINPGATAFKVGELIELIDKHGNND